MLEIKVPATSANLGAGFDCIGMAFQIYNTLYIEETDHVTPEEAEHQAGNLIYRTIHGFYEEVGQKTPSLHMIQSDDIPSTRGLGSSAACIVSGLIAANVLSGVNMPKEDLISMAARIEGHPDNSTPAFVGGITVGAMENDRLSYIRLNIPRLEELCFALLIPEFPLPTEKARGILPRSYPIEDVVYNTSRTALLVASLMNGDFSKLNYATRDKLHQPYRMRLIPDMQNIFDKALEYGAAATFLSGAGPTLAVVLYADTAASVSDALRTYITGLSDKWSLKIVQPDMNGASYKQ